MADEKYGIPTGFNNSLIQDYLKSRYVALDQQKNSAMDSLDNERSLMYDALGRAQLQNERDIFSRRIQAQRSGMSSSQLAATEVQNILAGQQGMQSIVEQIAAKESEVNAQFAGSKENVKADVFQILNQNMQSIAAVDAQKYASSGIAQIQDLFPNIDSATAIVLARQYTGATLTDSERNLVTSVTDPSIFITGTSEPPDHTWYINNVKHTSELSYNEYTDLWKKFNNTTTPSNSSNPLSINNF